MTENNSPIPGEHLCGKDGDKDNLELEARARRAKLTRRAASGNETEALDMAPTELGDETKLPDEDVYIDALQRFGIQI